MRVTGNMRNEGEEQASEATPDAQDQQAQERLPARAVSAAKQNEK
jgi:hypothetical protein